ncbi:hypothetical protein AWB81_08508 [Caballeronia arationis]|uniref:Uncharacterized protein n=1 Tax=Caballeronia arationis TaxID=1777142 RepID=A0A7Z7I1N3_9BURK|nr:hypothetical protein AWB81_08508 [Caballeronia arationis]SOE52961.1 hypothetical protein SAMN05446927_0570 [Caballeronia arationis]
MLLGQCFISDHPLQSRKSIQALCLQRTHAKLLGDHQRRAIVIMSFLNPKCGSAVIQDKIPQQAPGPGFICSLAGGLSNINRVVCMSESVILSTSKVAHSTEIQEH